MWVRLMAAVLAAQPLSALADDIAPQWTRMSEFYVRNDASVTRGDIFVNTHTGKHVPEDCVAGKWCTVEIGRFGLPADAKAVFLAGLLIITHGESAETADLNIAFRPYSTEDSPADEGYIGQATETVPAGGVRSGLASWVAVRDGKFQFKYGKSTEGDWPAHSSYGLNLTIQAWAR